MTTVLKKLEDEQVEHFDVEYVIGEMWDTIEDGISKKFGNKEFTFLDIGGGNGLFADRVLQTFPQAACILLDSSETLINRNRCLPRKILLYGSIDDPIVIAKLRQHKFDIIFLHWVLHHLVAVNYKTTLQHIFKVLTIAKSILARGGMISVFENLYNGCYIDRLPSQMIFNLTSSKLMAPMVKKLGANTAGCGVCFLSRNLWQQMFSKAGLEINDMTEYEEWNFSWLKKMLLHLSTVNVGHFWLINSEQSEISC